MKSAKVFILTAILAFSVIQQHGLTGTTHHHVIKKHRGYSSRAAMQLRQQQYHQKQVNKAEHAQKKAAEEIKNPG
jgi:hypothetical protein